MLESTVNNDVVKLLADIFRKRFGPDLADENKELRGKNFFGKELGLEPRDLLYLYFDVEREFDIRIPETDILRKKFCTFDDITDIICSIKSRKI